MSKLEELKNRSNNSCELCLSKSNLSIYKVEPAINDDCEILICKQCLDQITGIQPYTANNFRQLKETMWSETVAVQVMVWRILNKLSKEGWAQDLISQLYLDDETLKWAMNGQDEKVDDNPIITKDSNGTLLNSGDSVTLIKDLDVKGAGFTAKRGTLVKSIKTTDNPDQIEGKVNGTQIVLLTKFLKKV